MNQKQKKLQINKIFLPLVAALSFIILLLTVPAGAGPTTGQLQQQIDQLTAQVNRLRALIEDPNNKTYFAGLAAFSETFQDCLLDEDGLGCDGKKVILIDVLEGQLVTLDAVDNGPPQVSTRFYIEKLPRVNPLSSRDYRVHVKVEKGADLYYFDVLPNDPIFVSEQDSNYPVDLWPLKCELVTDSRIKIIMDFYYVDDVKQIRAESIGVITDANIQPYTESATETELKVTIKNIGDFPASYVVTATGFGPSIEPVAAESVFLNPDYQAYLTFPIRTVDTFAGQGPCLVTLKSDTGRRYDFTTADFPTPLPDPPPPEYIPDFDGDGDCDFADFGYFSLHWLEQPDT